MKKISIWFVISIPLLCTNAISETTSRYFVNYQVTDMDVTLTDGDGKDHVIHVKAGDVGKCTYSTKTVKKAVCKTINNKEKPDVISATDLGKYEVFEFNNHVAMKKYHFYHHRAKQEALQKALKTKNQTTINEVSSQTSYLV